VEREAQFVSAKVIFREPSVWGSSLWIDVGQKTNRGLGRQIVSKNSPVIIGTTVVGIVEYVGEKRSRVRLITDASLVPSVRAVRGEEQNRVLIEKINGLTSLLEARADLNITQDFQDNLLNLKKQLFVENSNLYLAKGELRGTSQPLWRSRGVFLKGVGFNYDFSDEEGPARHIHTGDLSNSLIRIGDLLVTTGMDGVFPKGLHVAYVASVEPLVEGACSYNITAKSLIENLDNLASVTVLPPYEEE
jgi:cell shape-determining protein MreC